MEWFVGGCSDEDRGLDVRSLKSRSSFPFHADYPLFTIYGPIIPDRFEGVNPSMRSGREDYNLSQSFVGRKKNHSVFMNWKNSPRRNHWRQRAEANLKIKMNHVLKFPLTEG